ncbi:restriction endonuclease subunit S [Streptomyces sp. N2-109]|uniref:Restriction endonuclease subunit S n=1 Tax=Streptomyces gossypii TaxID=2883101 RepID=A0ABT2JPA3_9ACTN|nr:restriction endonuclease subunit S [Streptomyces gossypii]MCT2589700.1 restriction endonuclease subunit S [Streptomyces gossypii]
MSDPVPLGWKQYYVSDLIAYHASGPSPTCEERQIREQEWGLLKTTAITWAGWDAAAHKTLPRNYWNQPALEVNNDDVLVTKAGPRHRVGVVVHVNDHPQPRLIVSGKMVLLRPRTQLVLPRILASALSLESPQNFLDERTSGMAESQVNFTNAALLRTLLTLPPIVEQRRIVEILDAVDEQIRSFGKVLAKAEARERGLIEAALSKVGRPSEPISMYLAGRPKNGYSPVETDHWTGVRALGLGCLTRQGFKPVQLKDVPKHDGRNLLAMLSDGDLLVSRANTRDLVGLVGIYRDVGTPCIYPDLMMRLTTNGRCVPEFLELVLRSSRVRRQIQAHAQGTSESMVKISSATVLGLQVQIPEIAVQHDVLSMVSACRSDADRVGNELRKLQNLRLGLVEDLLTGRVRF